MQIIKLFDSQVYVVIFQGKVSEYLIKRWFNTFTGTHRNNLYGLSNLVLKEALM